MALEWMWQNYFPIRKTPPTKMPTKSKRTRKLDQILHQLQNENLSQIVQVEFICNGEVLAKAAGNLVQQNGEIALQLPNYVRFHSNEQLSLGFELETTIEGKIGTGISFTARPRNSSGLIDLYNGAKSSRVTFDFVKFKTKSKLQQNLDLIGVIDQVPDGLIKKSSLVKKADSIFSIQTSALSIEGFSASSGTLVKMKIKKEEPEPFLLVGSAFYTFSMLAGRRVRWKYFALKNEGIIEICVFKKSSCSSNFYQAVHMQLLKSEGIDNLFEKVQQYLYLNPESYIGRIFGSLWDHSAEDFEVRALLVGVAIERVSKDIVEGQSKVDSNTNEFRAKVLKALDAALEGGTSFGDLNHAEIQRLYGIVKSFNPGTAKDTIKEASRLIQYKVSEKELGIWQQIRNKRSHGSFIWAVPNDEDWHQYLVCVDLLNILWLGACGFTDLKKIKLWSRMFPSTAPA